MYKNIIISQTEGIQIITINRPEQLNALNKVTIEELSNAIGEAEENISIGVIILTGAGEKSFVAGADIKEFADFNIAEGGALAETGQTLLFNKIEQLNKPVIAAINGFALGGGLELAMSCHLRLAAQNARLGLPEVSLGLIPGYGGTQRLAQLVGRGKANEMIFTAGMILADEALQIGLVNHVVEANELLDKCVEIANKIMRNSPMAIATAIQCVNAGYQDGVNGYEVEIESFGRCFGTKDFIEGTSAFLNKQKPSFRN
jgi:enoyl-CoA hydratase